MWLLDKALTRMIESGTLTIIDHQGRSKTYGTPKPGWPNITARLHDAKVASFIARHPRLGMGEAYMDGRITIEEGDIYDFIDFVRRNTAWEKGKTIDRNGPILHSGKVVFNRLNQINKQAASRRNVAHHYDLSDRLYDLFLDRDRQYSCAYWAGDPEEESLEQAQLDKKAHIAAKLALQPGQHVLDIGCGWGGMALYLNRKAGVRVTGITLSEEQLKVARRRAAEAGVADQVDFRLIDYRDLEGRYDRIVSVGMFEHVGPPNFRTFFQKCHDLLTDDGVMLVHTIGRVGMPSYTDAWTRKYIFPGGYIPALSEMVAASEPNRLMVTDVETLRVHYGYTLRKWYERCQAKKKDIIALYDERFFRMWSFYLAGAASTFFHGGMVNFQVQYARNRRTLPLTRDYMFHAEAELREPYADTF